MLCSSSACRGLAPIFLSLWIHFSACPTFQKVVDYLFLGLLLFFSSVSCWVCRCSKWFDKCPAELLQPDVISVCYYSAILNPPLRFFVFCFFYQHLYFSLYRSCACFKSFMHKLLELVNLSHTQFEKSLALIS